MQRTQHALTSLIKVVTCAILALGAVAQTQAQDKKVDPSGTWKWTRPGRNGGADQELSLKLKLDGDKVTGTLTQPQGGQTRDVEIKDAKLKGDEISFTTSVERGGNTTTSKYSGKISGDTLKGKIETDRNGQATSRDWEAKRAADKK